MANKIYYLTRSYAPMQKGGGPLMRKGAVENLRKIGWDVTVVMPAYENDTIVDSAESITIPLQLWKKRAIIYEMFGLYEDYLDPWVKRSFAYLKDKISSSDILIATAGGELGMIKLGALLKENTGCKLLINLRDPIDYTNVNGLKINKRYHVSREKEEKKYLSMADKIVTSSKTFKKILQDKYPILKAKIANNYFGYVEKVPLEKYSKIPKDTLRIAYVGNMEAAQRPELLLEAHRKAKNSAKIEIYFIGEYRNYPPLKHINESNVICMDYLPHEDFLEFMLRQIDVGFVSLADDYYAACFPSKIYEYINLGLPILGALPHGDAKEFINHEGYGFATYFRNIDNLAEEMDRWVDGTKIEKFKTNIMQTRTFWSMESQIKELDRLLRELV